MLALPVDTLPELLAPRGYVPAAEPPRLAPAHAGRVDLDSGEAADGEPSDRLERLLASAAAARARMAYGEAAATCAAGAAAARELRADDWAARFADEADAIGLLSPPGDDPPSLETMPASTGGADRGRRRLNSAIGLALGGGHEAALTELATAEAAMGSEDAFGRLLVVLNRAQVLLERGEVRAAATTAADALRAARREKHDYGAALAGLGVALTHLARGRRNEARARLGEAVRTFARYGDALRQVQCHYLLGEVAYAGEDPIRAGSHYRDALAVARPADAQAWIELLTLRFEHR
jgi:tetratricopeptide (TPR) repeat protein